MKILLVEDNPDDVDLITDAIKSSIGGATIKHIDNLQLFKSIIGDTNFDIILTDHNCGSFTGMDIIREIRDKNIEVPIVLLTDEHNLETSLAALELHVDDYVVKDSQYTKKLPDIIQRVFRNAHLESIKR